MLIHVDTTPEGNVLYVLNVTTLIISLQLGQGCQYKQFIVQQQPEIFRIRYEQWSTIVKKCHIETGKQLALAEIGSDKLVNAPHFQAKHCQHSFEYINHEKLGQPE